MVYFSSEDVLRVSKLSLPEVERELLRLLLDHAAWAEDWKTAALNSTHLVWRHADLDEAVHVPDEEDYNEAVNVLVFQDRVECVETVTRHLNFLRRYLATRVAASGDFPYGDAFKARRVHSDQTIL